MSKLERIVCVAAQNIMGVILLIMGKRMIGQACAVTTTISPTVVMMGAMLICTGLSVYRCPVLRMHSCGTP